MTDRPDLRALLVARYKSVAAASRAANLRPGTLQAALRAGSANVQTVRNIANAYANDAKDHADVLAYFGLSYLPEETA